MVEKILCYERHYDTVDKPKNCPAKCKVCTECTFKECIYPEILRWSLKKIEKEKIKV